MASNTLCHVPLSALSADSRIYHLKRVDPRTVFEPHIEPKKSPIWPQKVKTTPKLSQNEMSELKETKKMKIITLYE